MAKRTQTRRTSSDDPSALPTYEKNPTKDTPPERVPPAKRKVPIEELPEDTPRRADGDETVEERDAWARAHQYDTPPIAQPGMVPLAEGAWQPPDGDEEFEWDGTPQSIPDWADKGWIGYGSDGPVLQVPMIDYPKKGGMMRNQPYHTEPAKPGDTIKWVEKKRHFSVEHGEMHADEEHQPV